MHTHKFAILGPIEYILYFIELNIKNQIFCFMKTNHVFSFLDLSVTHSNFIFRIIFIFFTKINIHKTTTIKYFKYVIDPYVVFLEISFFPLL